MEFMFLTFFGELIGQLVASATFHYFNFNLFNICLKEVARNGNAFGSRRYVRECGNFKTWSIIFVENGLVNCSKSFGDCTVFGIYLRIFVEYIVDLLNQFTNTNQFMCVCRQGDILSFHGTYNYFGLYFWCPHKEAFHEQDEVPSTILYTCRILVMFHIPQYRKVNIDVKLQLNIFLGDKMRLLYFVRCK